MATKWSKFEDVKNIDYCETKNGYRFRFRMKDMDGNSVCRYFHAEKMLKRELYRFVVNEREKYVAEIMSDDFNIDSYMTFSQYYEKVYLEKRAVKALKDTTRHEYGRIYNRYIKDRIGKIKLCDLKKPMIEDYFSKMDDEGMPSGMQLHIYRHLRSVLNYAFSDELIDRNPALGKEMSPKHKAKKTRALTEFEEIMILDAANEEKPYWKQLLFFLAFTGCRRGEIAAIRWEDLDFDNDIIHVRRNAYKVRGQSIQVATPKTETSIRDLPMQKELKDVLLELIPFKVSQYVFYSSTNCSEPINPDTISSHIRDMMERIGIGHCTPHVFRGSLATILDRNHVPVSNAQKLLGHSDARVTLGYYINADEYDKEVAMDTFSMAIERAREKRERERNSAEKVSV